MAAQIRNDQSILLREGIGDRSPFGRAHPVTVEENEWFTLAAIELMQVCAVYVDDMTRRGALGHGRGRGQEDQQ